jgi:predicted nucleotide-binding protein
MIQERVLATRRTAPAEPQPANLTVDQMRVGIDRIQRRIDQLESFDPSSVQQRWAPQVTAIETSIEESLASVFGHNTVEYHRYHPAATLDRGPVGVGPDWISARLGRTSTDSDNLHDVHQYLAEGKQRAILLLRQAIHGLEEEIRDRGALSSTAPASEVSLSLDLSKIFIVHGHDGAPKAEVALFITRLGFEPVILHELPNKGRTLITKFQEEAAGIGFATVLLTPDDFGKAANASDLKLRARQNVILELGFFLGKIGPGRVAALIKGDIELPSDFEGVVYISLDKEDWQTKLGLELQHAGYEIDWNRVMRR